MERWLSFSFLSEIPQKLREKYKELKLSELLFFTEKEVLDADGMILIEKNILAELEQAKVPIGKILVKEGSFKFAKGLVCPYCKNQIDSLKIVRQAFVLCEYSFSLKREIEKNRDCEEILIFCPLCERNLHISLYLFVWEV